MEPTKVVPGDVMNVTVSIKSESPITNVTAEMPHELGSDLINLTLKNGSVYQGTWKGNWTVHDTEVKNYTTTVKATNEVGYSSEESVVWTDPTSLQSTSNTAAPAGAVWIEGSDLHWADGSTEYWIKDATVVDSSSSGPNGAFWIEGSYLHWIDANSDERKYQGPVYDSSPGGPNGAIWLEGNYIHYIDENGDERITDGT